MPPASAHFADSPVPAPPPIIGLPDCTLARKRPRIARRVSDAPAGSPRSAVNCGGLPSRAAGLRLLREVINMQRSCLRLAPPRIPSPSQLSKQLHVERAPLFH